jgi:hypothetical protein
MEINEVKENLGKKVMFKLPYRSDEDEFILTAYIAISLEKRLILIVLSPPTAGREHTNEFTFKDYFKS